MNLPMSVAFTIRTWSRRTFWLTFCQWMACQSTVLPKAAQAIPSFAFICFASCGGLPCSLVIQDLVEVCPFSRGMMLPFPGSIPIHPITGWPSLFPHSPTHHIIGAPCGALSSYEGNDGLTVFRLNNKDRLGSLFSPVAFTPMTRECRTLVPATCLFGRVLCSVHDPSGFHDVYQAFTFVNHTVNPSSDAL